MEGMLGMILGMPIVSGNVLGRCLLSLGMTAGMSIVSGNVLGRILNARNDF